MFNNLITYYHDYFIDETKDGYLLLRSTICLNIMNNLLALWIKYDSMNPIEELSDRKKNIYWNAACKHQQSKEKRILASKAAYALELITGKYQDL